MDLRYADPYYDTQRRTVMVMRPFHRVQISREK